MYKMELLTVFSLCPFICLYNSIYIYQYIEIKLILFIYDEYKQKKVEMGKKSILNYMTFIINTHIYKYI